MEVGHRRVLREPLAAVAATAGVRGCTPLGEMRRTRAAQIRRQFLGSGLFHGPWPRGNHRVLHLLAHLRFDMVREASAVHQGERVIQVAPVMELRCMAHRGIPPLNQVIWQTWFYRMSRCVSISRNYPYTTGERGTTVGTILSQDLPPSRSRPGCSRPRGSRHRGQWLRR